MGPCPQAGEFSVALTPQLGGATLRLRGCKRRSSPAATLLPLPAPTPQAGTWGHDPPRPGGCHGARPHAGTLGQGLGTPTLWPPSAGSRSDLLATGQVSRSQRETESRRGEATRQCPRWGARRSPGLRVRDGAMLPGRAERFPSRWVGRKPEQTVIKVRWCHPKFLLASRPARGQLG